jgi:hypothetical protein
MQEPINVKPFTINTPNLGAGGNNSGAPANPVSSFEGGNNMQDVNQGSGSSSGGSALSYTSDYLKDEGSSRTCYTADTSDSSEESVATGPECQPHHAFAELVSSPRHWGHDVSA